MLRSTWNLSLMTVLTATALMACGDDKGTTDATASTSGATDLATTTAGTGESTTEAPTSTTGASATDGTTSDTTPTTGATTMVGGETAADGEACTANGDCASVACLKFRDLEDGQCVAAPDGRATRFAGTLLDFVSGGPMASTELRVIGAFAALSDPVGAPAVVTGNSDADGKVDIVSPAKVEEGIGVIGIITGGDYYTTATGLASPTDGVYGPMNGNRDIWGIPSAKLTEWSGYLMADADIAASLPLGGKGGVVGFVRDGAGAPKAGAKVVSVKGDASTAKIRYLAADGLGFTSDMTSSTGIFVLVAPGLAEKFKVEGGTVEGSAGSAANVVFVMILTEP